MDQTKIGKLIAKLRKEKGLTQRELGDKVGVGFKAVSKWERGITCPDISIINELSKILGITSDELLTGELSKDHQTNTKNNHKLNKNFFFIIPVLLLIVITIFIILKINNNRTNVYELASTSDEYYVEGKVAFNKNDIEIYINKLNFNNKKFKNMIVKNYEYSVNTKNDNLFSYGYISTMQELSSETTVSEFSDNFKINYTISNEMYKDKIIDNGLTLKITFLDINYDLIEKNISLTLTMHKK